MPLWDFLRRRIWTLAAALVLAAGALWLLGPHGVWGLALLALAAAIILQFLAPVDGVAAVPLARAADPLAAILPPTRSIFEHVPAPVLLLDGGSRVLVANEAMRRLLGQDVVGRPISAILRTPDVLAAIARTAESGAAEAIEFVLPVPIERHFEARTARMSESPRAVALLLHDVTAIRRSEQMRADFVANASHELRTPLAAVSGFIDTLRGHAKDDAAAREQFLGIMAVEAARMRRLIDDLLSLTRIELNEHVPPSGRVKLKSIVQEAAAALAPLAAADNIGVSVSGGDALPDIIGDRDELVQLFQNLIHNAIKYGREGGHVSVALGVSGRQIFAAVKDDGEGIPATAIPRLTERFYRVDVQRSRQKGGTGLGLAIVKHILSRHQGKLTIESKAGEGSVFTVFLPEIAQEMAAKPVPAPAVTEML